MTQDTLFQNLYIVYFKQRSRIVKYNTHFKDETVCFMVKHHAHSIRLSKSTAPAGSVADQDPLLCGHRPCLLHHVELVRWSVHELPLRESRLCTSASHVSIWLIS